MFWKKKKKNEKEYYEDDLNVWLPRYYKEQKEKMIKKQKRFVYLEILQGMLLEEMYKNPYFYDYDVIMEYRQDELEKIHEKIDELIGIVGRQLAKNITQEEYIVFMNVAYGHADNILDEVLGDEKYIE